MAALAADVSPSQDTDDHDLVAGIRAGDDRAFEVLYERYQPRMALYIRGMVQDHGRSEDITQEVFISALRRIRETDTEIVAKPWLYEIAKNACIDAFRRSRNTNEVSFDAQDALRADDHGRLADARATPDMAVDTKLDLDNLRGAFGGLSDTHHQIIVMRELEGRSYRDIGDRLGMSRPAVESTLFRARRRLEEEYDELVSGKRCVRVRGIIDAGGRSPGVRDQRRLDRHISHCQPCRRHALMAGMDLEARPARSSVAARIAAFLPLPALWRRSGGEDAPTHALGATGQSSVAQWSANVASTVDPATLGGWGKAVFAAATVAVAGMGAGAAISERDAVRDFLSNGGAGSTAPGHRWENGGVTDRAGGASEQRTASGKRFKDSGPGTKVPGKSTTATRGASGSGAASGKPPRREPGSGAPGGKPKPHPIGASGSGGASGGGHVGALLDKTLGGKPGAGAGSASAVSGVTSTADNLAGQLDDAVSGVTGSTGTSGVASPSGVVQGVTSSATSALGSTLGGH